jgi:hypothetical protein
MPSMSADFAKMLVLPTITTIKLNNIALIPVSPFSIFDVTPGRSRRPRSAGFRLARIHRTQMADQACSEWFLEKLFKSFWK